MGAGRAFVYVAFALLLLSLRVSAGQASETPVATINGEMITVRDIIRYARQSPMLAGYLNIPGGPMKLLENLLIEKVFVLEGERLKIPRTEDDDDFTYSNRVRGDLVPTCPVPSDDEARAFYDAHPERFSTPLYLRLRRIGLAVTADTVASVTAELDALRQKIVSGEASFEAIADAVSQDIIGQGRGGDIGFVPVDKLKPATVALLLQQPDTIIGPLREGDELFLYQVTDRREPILAPYETLAKEEIAQAQRQVCNQRALGEILEELRQRWSVEVLVDEIGVTPESTPN